MEGRLRKNKRASEPNHENASIEIPSYISNPGFSFPWFARFVCEVCVKAGVVEFVEVAVEFVAWGAEAGPDGGV